MYPEPDDPEAAARVALRNCPVFDSKERIYACLGKSLVAMTEHAGRLQVIWDYKTEGHIPGSPALGTDGRIRVHSGDGQLHCVGDTGEPAFSPVSVGQPLDWASPVVDENCNTWVCSYTGGLIKIDPGGTRSARPFFRSRQKFDSTGLVRGNVFYVGAEDGFVYAIDISGSKGRNSFNHVAGQGKTDWFINSSPALSPEGTIVVAGRDEYLYGFGRDGKRAWRLHIRGQILASPIVDAEGNVFAGVCLVRKNKQTEGKLVCVDANSHRIRWEYQARGAVECTPVLGDDGLVYFGDNSGTVHALDPAGQRRFSVNVGSAVRSAGTIPSPNRVVFGLDNGSLVALACASKALAASGWPKYMGPIG